MTEQQHPITPPPELVWQWHDEWMDSDESGVFMEKLATQAARWGADQELEACVEWLVAHGWFGSSNSPACCGLRAARRPRPSLKEQALDVIENSEICDHLSPEHAAILRRALEQRDD